MPTLRPRLALALIVLLTLPGLCEPKPGELLSSSSRQGSSAGPSPIRAAVAALPGGGWCAGNLAGEVFCRPPGGAAVQALAQLPGPVLSAPLVLDDFLIVASSTSLQAFALKQGRPSAPAVWQRELADLGLSAQSPRWDAYLPDPIALAQGQELLLAHGRDVMRLRATDGRPIWRQTLPQAVQATPRVDEAGQAAWLADQSGKLHKLDLRDGSLLQSWQLAQGLIQGQPAQQGDTVWVGGRDAHLRAYSLSQARELWAEDRQGNWIMAGPVLTKQGLIVSAESDGFRIRGQDASSGALRWQYQLDQNVFQGPAMDGDTLIFASGAAYQTTGPGRLTALNSQGRLLWQIALPAASFARPQLQGRRLLLGDESGQVHELGLD
ncbi:hypothetical protein DBR47_07790 [Paucibacter sp. KBW04]|uniref:outer membrane protein assembly factor BamB family protein n=1 Tax=Paucibacter sp. KBW04 TaxID=2153361 RepID=UPI000F57BD82|nr:PQQ-binding-like beta-propeller repeat protein [Paucibacter sp. KBW04]RQO61131.1 hypothetical protein DBR47_07790 [Paucibacter sp. KBW04]